MNIIESSWRRLGLAMTFMAVSAFSFSQNSNGRYDALYKGLPVAVKSVTPPATPDRQVSLTDFGATGDGITPCTEAFAKAISSLGKQGGGTLNIPAGIWLTGPIQLKSNIHLHLDANAIIYFSPQRSLYADSEAGAKRVNPCIKASKCSNISITGKGIIDGNGKMWRPVKRSKVSDVEWKRFKAMGGEERQQGSLWYPWDKSGKNTLGNTPEEQESRRNDIIRLTNCENVLIQGVTIQNSPRFHVHPINCRNVIIEDVTVRCPWNAQNGDAIDISDCHQVLIKGCTVDAGDDGLCMKSGDTKPTNLVNGCEDILITDNTILHAHGGFVIGSEDISGMRRIVVRNCRMSGTDTGLRFKSGIGRGGKTEDIYISGIQMADINDEAVIFQCDYVNRAAGDKGDNAQKPTQYVKIPEFTGIHISGVTCREAKVGVSASGIEGFDCVHGIDISNSIFVYTGAATKIDTKTAKIKMAGVKFVKHDAASATDME